MRRKVCDADLKTKYKITAKSVKDAERIIVGDAALKHQQWRKGSLLVTLRLNTNNGEMAEYRHPCWRGLLPDETYGTGRK